MMDDVIKLQNGTRIIVDAELVRELMRMAGESGHDTSNPQNLIDYLLIKLG